MALTQQDLHEISQLMDPLKSTVDGIRQKLQNIQSEMQNIQSEMTDMKSEMTDMKNNISTLSQRVSSLEVHIENETDRNIRILAENHLDIIRKLNEAIDAHKIPSDISAARGAFQFYPLVMPNWKNTDRFRSGFQVE